MLNSGSGWGGGKLWWENGDNCIQILIKKSKKENVKFIF